MIKYNTKASDCARYPLHLSLRFPVDFLNLLALPACVPCPFVHVRALSLSVEGGESHQICCYMYQAAEALMLRI